MLQVTALPALEDNYVWLIRDTAAEFAVVVDPGDDAPVLEALERDGLKLAAILVTHHHYDHVEGIEGLTRRFPSASIYGPDDPRIPLVTDPVSDGDEISVPEIGAHFQVLATPGHTRSHLVYHGHQMLFCGDTLFSIGCGRLFEGTSDQMHTSLSRIAALPDETRIYCAHEYTAENLTFARLVDPHNADLAERADEVLRLRAENRATLPISLATEKRTNPFLRFADPHVAATAEKFAGHPLTREAQVFATLRRWKDTLD